MGNRTSGPSSIHKLSEDEKLLCAPIRVILNCGIGGAICTLGLAGNLLAFFILKRGPAAPVATFLLRCLAVTDNCFLVVWLINFALKDLLKYMDYNSVAWKYTRLYSYPLLYITQFATIWLTVLITFIRYLGMCKPYFSRKICSLKNVKFAIVLLYLIVIVYNIPRFFEHQTELRNGTIWLMGSWLGRTDEYKLIYAHICYNLFTFGLPFLLLSILNVRLVMAYRQLSERRRRRSLTSRRPSQIDEANFTLVMIVIVAVFVVCQLPARIVQIMWNYHFKSCRSLRFYIMELSTLLEVLNSSVNFIIYSFLRPQFRRHLTSSLFSCRPSEELPQTNERQIENVRQNNQEISSFLNVATQVT